MKKLFLALVIGLISFNLNAVEHVIGGSIGYGLLSSNTTHEQKNEYHSTLKDPDTGEVVDVYRNFTWSKDTNSMNSAYNLDIEYQLRSDSFWTLGLGYRNENIVINNSYELSDGNKMMIHAPYALALATFYETKSLALRLGFSVGQNFNTIGDYSYEHLNGDLIADMEYSLSNDFMLFTRLNINAIGKKVDLKTNLIMDNPLEYDAEDVKVLESNIRINPEQLLRLNFGIRFKL